MKKALSSAFQICHLCAQVSAILTALITIIAGCTSKDYECTGLSEHNMYRNKYENATMLTLDNELTELAQKCAKYYLQKAVTDHSCNKGSNGENLYSYGAKKVSNMTKIEIMQKAVKAWHAEVKDYNFKTGLFSKATGHFTQLVWRNTSKLGLALLKNDNGTMVYVIAIYSPPGNVNGEFLKNVQMALKNQTR